MFPRTGRTSISPADGGCTIGARTRGEGATAGTCAISGTWDAATTPAATHQRTGTDLIRAALRRLLPGARDRPLSRGLRGWRRGRLRTEPAERPRDLRANLRVHVGRACRDHVHRNPVASREPGDVVVRTRQI